MNLAQPTATTNFNINDKNFHHSLPLSHWWKHIPTLLVIDGKTTYKYLFIHPLWQQWKKSLYILYMAILPLREYSRLLMIIFICTCSPWAYNRPMVDYSLSLNSTNNHIVSLQCCFKVWLFIGAWILREDLWEFSLFQYPPSKRICMLSYTL